MSQILACDVLNIEKEDLVGFNFVDGVGLMRGDILRVWEVTAKFES